MKIWEAAFYQKSLKRGLSSMMLCFIFSGALLLLTLFFYPKIASSGLRESIEEITRVFPSEMLRWFGLDQLPDFTVYDHYLSGVLQVQLLIGCVFSSFLGTTALIQYESENSIVFLYAQAISRLSIVGTKLICQLTLLTLYNIGIFLIVYLVSAAFVAQAGLFLLGILRVFLASFLVELFYLCIGFFLSGCLSHSSQSLSTALMLMIATLLFGMMSNMFSGLGFLQYFCPYLYFQVYPLLSGNFMGLPYLLICLLFSIVCVAGCGILYQKKDFQIG